MKALLLVDLQNDFFPRGSLAVKDGDKVLPAINKLLHLEFDLIIATKDWHPSDHLSFAENHQAKVPGEVIFLSGHEQVLWPNHCVQNTYGSEFAKGWDTHRVHRVFYKGTNKFIDSYSAFYDNAHQASTGLAEYLKENAVTDLYIAGLATDYCIKYTVLDALNLGFNVYVYSKGCRAVNLQLEDEQKAIDEMVLKGAKIFYE